MTELYYRSIENRDTQILTTRKCFRNLLDVVFLAPPAHLCYCCHGGEKVTEEDGSKMALLSAFPPLRINSQAPRNQGSVLSNEMFCFEG